MTVSCRWRSVLRSNLDHMPSVRPPRGPVPEWHEEVLIRRGEGDFRRDRRLRRVHARRHDPDHLEIGAIQRERPADDCGFGGEELLPNMMA